MIPVMTAAAANENLRFTTLHSDFHWPLFFASRVCSYTYHYIQGRGLAPAAEGEDEQDAPEEEEPAENTEDDQPAEESTDDTDEDDAEVASYQRSIVKSEEIKQLGHKVFDLSRRRKWHRIICEKQHRWRPYSFCLAPAFFHRTSS